MGIWQDRVLEIYVSTTGNLLVCQIHPQQFVKQWSERLMKEATALVDSSYFGANHLLSRDYKFMKIYEDSQVLS